MTAMALPEDDPVNRLATWLSVIDITSQETAAKLARNEKNRLSILFAHAVYALAVAPLFAAQLSAPGGMDNPSYAVLRHIPGTPYSLVFILGLGGAILLPATMLRHRPTEMLGLVLLIAWYAAMCACQALAALMWLLAGATATGRPSVFGPLIYAHILTILVIHLRTLSKLGRRQDRL